MKSSGAEFGSRLVLDSSAYSHLRHGHPVVLDALAAADTVLVPVIVVGELEAAFELGTRPKENRLVLDEFLKEPFVSTAVVTPSIARRYGQLFAQLRRNGTPIPVNDIWIAATTLDRGGQLLSFDRHFARIEQLDLRLLEPRT